MSSSVVVVFTLLMQSVELEKSVGGFFHSNVFFGQSIECATESIINS